MDGEVCERQQDVDEHIRHLLPRLKAKVNPRDGGWGVWRSRWIHGVDGEVCERQQDVDEHVHHLLPPTWIHDVEGEFTMWMVRCVKAKKNSRCGVWAKFQRHFSYSM
jgi:hypothetical protein